MSKQEDSRLDSTHCKREKIYSAFLSFCLDALETIKKNAPVTLSPQVDRYLVVHEEAMHNLGQVYGINQKIVADWYSFLAAQRDTLIALPACEFLRSAVMEDDVFRSHFINTIYMQQIQTINWDLDQYILQFLQTVLEGSESLVFNIDKFNETYRRLEEFVLSDSVDYTWLAPLPGFASDVNVISLGSEVCITTLSAEQLKTMIDGPSDSFSLGPADATNIFLRSRFFIAVKRKIKKVLYEKWIPPASDDLAKEQIGVVRAITGPPLPVEAQQVSINAIHSTFLHLKSALRLFKSGQVGYPFIYGRPPSHVPHQVSSFNGDFDSIDHCFYSLRDNEVSEFAEFWEKFSLIRLEEKRAASVALRRFNYSYRRPSFEDPVIDLMIALEALFLPRSKDQGELRYRLSLRGAYFLGSNGEERKRLFHNLRMAYDLRSILVHGGQMKPEIRSFDEKMTSSEFIKRFEDIVRQAIRKFLFLSAAEEKQIIENIDQSILE